ncbi:lipoprotein [Enterococcus thailandicus]|uniref:LptM family lipoprotein n=1 Tax=Enterococcus thailandicus TaxID=417368 RepID=UPI00094C0C8E|nr:hypothetical protein [Enterococcus thailandicus]GMC04602.1 lipoprotein [Enterococcus thailandicus]GMC10524.1 lipoprotein [Enterococcus thailandicus]
MKKWLLLFVAIFSMITLSACGSKMDKTGEEFKQEIMKDSAYGDEYKEDGFSFLIYKDEDSNRYLADVWVPVSDKESALEYYYFYDENKRLDSSRSEVSFNDMKSSGNYEVIYKTGKFK